MPDKDGPEVCQLIRKLCSVKGVPQPYICCCSAYGESKVVRKAMDAGTDKFLSKPVEYW